MKIAFIVLMVALPLHAAEKRIDVQVVVNASLDDVWNAWTTVDGVKSFFAGGARIEPHPDGAYEIFFDPSQPEGHRGADGMRILVFEPKRRLAFTWNAPEDKFPNARKQRTRVTIVFTPVGEKQTRVALTHDGFGDGEEWEKVHAYFQGAWKYVLGNLEKRFAGGQ
ncbi:MAG TPA: SRPBCC domain-containing protein [Thermoanaerobaculia bacterium]|nr:SRPBCC domain-containing protein [Thermoanaerobaculia bacterium]